MRLAAAAERGGPPGLAVAARVVAAARRGVAEAAEVPPAPGPDQAEEATAWTATEIAAAVTGWAAGLPATASLATAIADARRRLEALRRPDASLTLATAHGTKGLEWDHVAVIGMTAGRFPSARSLAEAPDPARAMEEERRLAYVAWTRARRTLILVFDPNAPSQFLGEAFDAEELCLSGGDEA